MSLLKFLKYLYEFLLLFYINRITIKNQQIDQNQHKLTQEKIKFNKEYKNIYYQDFVMNSQTSYNQRLLRDSQNIQDAQNDQYSKAYLSKIQTISGSTFFQKLFFTWLLPFLSYGSKKGVSIPYMPKLPQRLATQKQYNRMYNIWLTTAKSKTEGLTLSKVFFKAFKKQWIEIIVMICVVVTLFALGPFFTAFNIDYIKNHQGQISYGITLFMMTLMCTFFHKLIFEQLFYRFSQIGLNLSNSLTMMVYCKSLKYPSLAQKQFTQAEIINYSQVDAQRMTYMGYHLAAFVYGPMQIIGGLAIMYSFIGISFFSGLAVIILLFFMSYLLSNKMIKYNKSILSAKDQRMKVTQQVLDIIRFVKINVIQKFFFKKLDDKRAVEINNYVKKGMCDVLLNCTFWLTCPLLLSAIFLTYILLGNQMTSQVAFTTMMISNLIEYPIYGLPTAISQVIQIMSSINRIQKFLMSKQRQNTHIKYQLQGESDFAIQIEDGDFYWQKQIEAKKQIQETKVKLKKETKQIKSQGIINYENDSESQKDQAIQTVQNDSIISKDAIQPSDSKIKLIHALKNINLKVPKGKLTMIIGDIGSGKSSLLCAILNQMNHSQKTRITIAGSLAYAAQKPWIMSGTLKDNIIFTLPYQTDKFQKVIKYSSLDHDLSILPKRQETEIGQKGINISGGQKARVSLARALYSQKDIYLLDDILSAVDVHVGQFILKQTLKGYLKNKTVIMPTHAIKFVQEADQILIMKKGSIVKQGHYSQIYRSPQFLQIYNRQAENQKAKKQQKQDQQDNLDEQIALLKQAMKLRSQSAENRQQQLIVDQVVEELILPEDHKVGKIDWKIFQQYIKLNGGIARFVFLVILVMFLWISFKTASSLIMQKWCQDPIGQNYDLYLYIGFILFSNVFVLIRSYTMVISSARQSTTVHRSMIKGLLYASLSNFYNRVPVGRIINRLTKDLRELDEAITNSIANVLITIFQLLSILVVCVYASSPFAIIPMILAGWLSMKFRNYYLKTQRQMARFEKSTNSPVVSGFMSTISGLTTIRAYQVQHQFTTLQIQSIDINKTVRLNKSAMQNWFALHLAFLSFLVNMPCIAFCMFDNSSNPSLVGLLMVYALSLSDNIIGLVLSMTDFQTKLVSLERIYKFMHIQPEKDYTQYCLNWSPQEEGCKEVFKNGIIQFSNLHVRYRMDLPDVLMKLSCKISQGEKVGIVGRTGAGKTTIINSLLRITDISKGDIFIDGNSILSYSLKDLRNSITMIDQQPTLIKSTFRQNLDLTGKYTDQELLNILKECNLLETINQKGGLSGEVSNTSLSAGEKQLLCICRAFLKHSKIVLIDQATANIDVKNDAIIQRVISEKFKESTVLTIAHRLSTLKNSNKIMVMDKGMLVEFGSPYDLQNRQGGIYREMITKNSKQFLV